MKRSVIGLIVVAILIGMAPARAFAQPSGDQNGDGYVCIKGTEGRDTIERDNNVGGSAQCPRGFLLTEVDYEFRDLDCTGATDCDWLKKWCLKAKRDYSEFIDGKTGEVTGTCHAPRPLPG